MLAYHWRYSSRRTRRLFAEAFGPQVAIGVIAVPDPDYDPKRWWQYSEGVKEVFGETVALVYAEIFFYPTKNETPAE